MIEAAQRFAHDAHDSIGQRRKYSGQPYWVHTDEVARIVASVTTDAHIISAAHLHDVLEDVTPSNGKFGASHIHDIFGSRVSDMVIDLTDVFVKENYPHLNRATRKELERTRMGKISNDSKTVKLADLISNSKDITGSDKDFSRVYLREKALLLPFLVGGDKTLFSECVGILKASGHSRHLPVDILAMG